MFFKCPLCAVQLKDRSEVARHRFRYHKKIGKSEYRDLVFNLSPKDCKCGCGKKTKWLQREYKYNDWVNGHNKSRLGYSSTPAQIRAATLRAKRGELTFLGRKHSDTTKKKISEKNLGRLVGDKNPMWKGGVAYRKYPWEFNKNLKAIIRGRDNGVCQSCGNSKDRLAIHHIDYDKKNCSFWNLITLCDSCHGKTNYHRQYWEMVCKELMCARKREFTEWSKASSG